MSTSPILQQVVPGEAVAGVIHPRLMTLEPSPWRDALLCLAAQLSATAIERDQRGGDDEDQHQLLERQAVEHPFRLPSRLSGASRCGT